MGRRRATGSGLSVGEILNEAQRGSASSHIRYAKALWECTAEDTSGTYTALQHAAKLFMGVPEKTVHQDRLLRFFAAFAAEVASQEQLDFLEPLIAALAELSRAKEHTLRWRACQLLQALVGGLPADAALADDVADALQEAMLERLEDGKPAVRAAAVRALARLPDPGADGSFDACPVVEALLELLAWERSKEVRKAVLATLPAAARTKPVFLERTRDEADDVRKVTYLAIAEKLPLVSLSAEEQALLVRRGLGDRARPVAEAASRMLEAWLEGPCHGEPLVLLRGLGAAAHPEEAEMMVKALVGSGRLSAVHLGKLAESDGLGLRADFGAADAAPLTPESALFWRVICEWLYAEATSKGLSAANAAGAAASIDAAVAGDRLEALEAALPPTVEEMARVVAMHVQAGPEHRFATGQLMCVAANCMDFTDATGRAATATMLHSLLSEVPAGEAAWEGGEEGAGPDAGPWASESWRMALALFLRKVYGSPAELADALLGVLGQLHAAAGFGADAPAPPSEAAWLHVLGVAGLLLGQLPSARAALATSSPFTLGDVLHRLVQPGLRQRSAAVRREAARCLGLYCLLGDIPTSLASHVRVLRALLVGNEAPGVRAVAAQALGDLASQRGIRELDAFIPSAAAAADEQEQEEGAGADPTLDPELLRLPLLELLFNRLADWRDDFAEMAAAAGKRPRNGRSASSPADLEQTAGLGLALVESLARLLLCNRFWLAREEAAGRPLGIEELDVVKALVELLLLNFDPSTEAASRLRQALPVFFESYAHQHERHHMYLATALLPAARRAAAEDAASGRRVTAASASAPTVMRFVATLLQVPVAQADGKVAVVGHEMLADQLLKEVLKVGQLRSAPKYYLATLCKLLLALHINAGQADLVHGLRLLADQACALLTEHDRAVARDLESLRDRLAALDASPLPQLSEADVATLLEAVKSHEADSLLADYPLPFEEEGEDGGEAPVPSHRGGGPRPRGKTPAPRGRSGRRRAATPSDSEGEEEEESDGAAADAKDDSEDEGAAVPRMEPAAAPKRNAARAGRSTKRMVESSGSEGEEDDADETVSPLPQQPQKVQRMRSTPFNRLSGVPKLEADDGEAAAAAAGEEEEAPAARPARHGTAQQRSKPGPKRSLAAAAARKVSAAVGKPEEAGEEGNEAASPAIKQPQKVQRMRESPFNHGSGKPKLVAAAAAGASRLGGGRRTAKNVVADSSDSEDEQKSEAAAASDSENSEAVSGKSGAAAQPSSSEVSSLRRALRDNRI